MPFPTGYRHKARSQKNGGYRERQNRAITVNLGIFVPQPSALPFINATTAVFATRHIANGSLATRYAITRQPRHPARRSSRACRPICHSGQAGQMARHGDQACRRHAANGSLRFPAAYPFGTEVPGGSGKGAPHSLQWVSPSSFCAPQDRHVPNGMRGMLAVAQPPPLHCLGNSFASPCFIGTIAMASASFFPSASLHVDAALSTLPTV